MEILQLNVLLERMDIVAKSDHRLVDINLIEGNGK